MQAVIAQNPFTADLSCAAMDLYRDLPDLDFSRQILAGAESALRVLQAAAVDGAISGPEAPCGNSASSADILYPSGRFAKTAWWYLEPSRATCSAETGAAPRLC